MCNCILQVGDWPYHPHGRLHAAPSPGGNSEENCTVFVSAKEGGKIQYPGRNDAPLPERLRRRGYERVTIAPRDMGAFEKRHGVTNERRHWDRNGRGV